MPAAEADVRRGGRDDHARERLVVARARHRTEGADEIAVAAVVVDEEVAAQRLAGRFGEAVDEAAQHVEIRIERDDADVDFGDVGRGARERARREPRQDVE